MGGLAGCRRGGGGGSLVVLVSEKPNLVSEKSGKSQGILFICGAGNPDRTGCILRYIRICIHAYVVNNILDWSCFA